MLYRNLAFPLLRELVNAGDLVARRVFKEEIALRLQEKNRSVILYLLEEGYSEYLNSDEIDSITSEWIYYKKEKIPVINNILFLDLRGIKNLNEIEGLFELESLQELSLNRNWLTTLPESLGNLKSLERLDLSENQLTTLPESIGDLTSLKELDLWENRLTTLPESIGNLISLQTINLKGNQISILPESIGDLSSLKILNML
ncbi:unnamed protein product, partial [marine sediment metagenome]